ncbi:MAG: DUF6445 family protein [Sphingomonas sp.]|jgi:hypothetical protein
MSRPQIRVEWIGRERTPIVIIDDLAPAPEDLRQAACALNFVAMTGQYYPGTRAVAPDDYFEAVFPPVVAAMNEFYQCPRPLLRRCYYSLTCTPPDELTSEQTMPHFDTMLEGHFAVVHFLCAEQFGGTAFFAHRQTGFETITIARHGHYAACLAEELAGGGTLPCSYPGGSSPWFEKIAAVAARENRAVIFPGKLLHSADVANAQLLSADPMVGRLTVVSFLSRE